MPRLSIITINKNNAAGLRRTIESVIHQTFDDFEYLIIDGASTDGSVDVIRDYEQKISWWISEPDTGIYNAMNKGIRQAKGEFCQFLNSGDYLVEDEVAEKMMKNLPDSGILYGNMIKYLDNNKKKIVDKKITEGEITFLNLFKGTLNHSCAYIKRDLFKKYGLYDESLRIVSDWKFFLQLVGLKNEKVTYRDIDVLVFDMSGISNSNETQRIKEREKVLEELLPKAILEDYKSHSYDILRMQRINRYKLTKWLVWFIERCLFKIEKWSTKNTL